MTESVANHSENRQSVCNTLIKRAAFVKYTQKTEHRDLHYKMVVIKTWVTTHAAFKACSQPQGNSHIQRWEIQVWGLWANSGQRETSYKVVDWSVALLPGLDDKHFTNPKAGLGYWLKGGVQSISFIIHCACPEWVNMGPGLIRML